MIGKRCSLTATLLWLLACDLPSATTTPSATASSSNSGAHSADGTGATSGGGGAAGGGGSATGQQDAFGVAELYQTVSGGREWFLPTTADRANSEWRPETDNVAKVSDGVFHTSGTSGEVRLNVLSPSGKAWWRDVEMTGYFRYTGDVTTPDQLPHFEMMARNERHSPNTILGTAINSGFAPPAGTLTWPGYPYGNVNVNAHCLGASYHGNFYPNEETVLFEKEVSHENGYASQRKEMPIPSWTSTPVGRWFGMKFVVRNSTDSTRVHMELWVDSNADGSFTKVTQFDDSAGTWQANSSSLDGCTAAPFKYTPGILINWAGPWVIFRSDSMAIDFKWLSVREIGPVP
jgi:hypothetical protein